MRIFYREASGGSTSFFEVLGGESGRQSFLGEGIGPKMISKGV